MHGHVRRVGDEPAVGREDGAAEVEPLFDVDGRGGALQRAAHLLGDRHEPMAEHAEPSGVDRADDRSSSGAVVVLRHHQSRRDVDDEVALGRERRRRPGLEHARRRADGDHRRAGDLLVRDRERRLVVDGGVVDPARLFEVEPRAAVRGRRPGMISIHRLVDVSPLRRGRATDGAHADVVDDDVLLRRGAELEAVFAPKRRVQRLGVRSRLVVGGPTTRRHSFGRGDHDRVVGAGVAEVEEPLEADIRTREDGTPVTTIAQRLERRGLEGLELGVDRPFEDARVERRRRWQDWPRLVEDDVGQAHAVRRQDARVRVDDRRPYAERPRDGAHVLRAGATETRQHVRRGVVAARFGELANRPTHRLVGDSDEPRGDGLRREHHTGRWRLRRRRRRRRGKVRVDLGRQRVERAPRGLAVERQIFVGPEDRREPLGQQPAEHEVRVRHGEHAARFPVAHGPRVRLGRLGAHDEGAFPKEEPRPAAGGDGVDVELRALDLDARRLGLEHVLEALAVVPRHVRRRPAHVEPDDGLDLLLLLGTTPRKSVLRGSGVADDAARGPREHGAEARKRRGRGHAAVGLHKEDLRRQI
mmetsp:Transcript_13778/g.55128  ORF Transcript_13778/g.55128 Transcript_13778/m.55128 type:complete len:586 (+) Transcript_13778:1923-3680(+)